MKGAILCTSCRKTRTTPKCLSCGAEHCFIMVYRKGKHHAIRRQADGNYMSYFDAVKALVSYNEELENPLGRPDQALQPAMSVSRKLNEWLREKQKEAEMGEFSRNTTLQMEMLIRTRYEPFFGKHFIHEIDKALLKEFKLSMEDVAPSTRRTILAYFHAFLAWLVDNGKLVDVPAFPTVRVPESTKVGLDVAEQLAAILLMPEKYRDVFLFGAETGTRSGELVAIKMKDLNLHKRVLTVRRTEIHGHEIQERTKSRKDRLVPLSSDALWIIARHVAGKNPDDFLFINPQTRLRYTRGALYATWKRYATEDFRKLSVHELIRHSFCTSLLRIEGSNLSQVQSLVGHADVATTQGYVHLLSDTLRPILEKRKPFTYAEVVDGSEHGQKGNEKETERR